MGQKAQRLPQRYQFAFVIASPAEVLPPSVKAVFLQYYGLTEQPFGVTPDSRFLYLGTKHREALASLIYGTDENRGFLALIAKAGTGKTSLLYQYLELLRDYARTAYIFRTDCDARDLLSQIVRDLGVSANVQDPHEALNQAMLEQVRAGRRLVVVIDEAQDLTAEVLESIRLLSNFETSRKKLLQIVIAGQPQLAGKLAQPSMVQLRQRISLLIRLEPLTKQETNAYIDHRLRVAGYDQGALFTAEALTLIAENSAGIPRNINNLCFNAMALAFAMNKKRIDQKVLEEVIADLEIEQLLPEAVTVAPATSGVNTMPVLAESKLMGAVRQARRISTRRPTLVLTFAAVLLGLITGSFWSRSSERTQRRTAAIVKPQEKLLTHTAMNAPIGQRAVNQSSRAQKLPNTAGATMANAKHAIMRVTVDREASLRQISLEYLGRTDRPTIDLIRELNPSISDADHIEAGEQLRLPMYLRRSSPTGSRAAALVDRP